MSVELLYRVEQLVRVGDTVKMSLQEVRTVPPEEITRARLEAEAEPENDMVDEGEQFQKVDLSPKPKTPMGEFFRAMIDEIPELADAFKRAPRRGGGGRVMMAVPISQMIEVYFTPEQYAELGSPPLLSILKVSLKLETNAQKVENSV